MTWTDRLQNTVFTITTGDGKVFTPLWKGGETQKEFNATVFEFINLPGALVDRKKVGPRKFPMVFWFTGDNNIDLSELFDQSANDSRAWVVRHPWYGDITGHPLSISRVDADLNVTEFSVDFWETISGTFPKQTISIADAIDDRYSAIQNIAPVDYVSKASPAPADVSALVEITNNVNTLVSRIVVATDLSAYQLQVNSTLYDVGNLILAPVPAIQSIGALLYLPARMAVAIGIKIDLFNAVYNGFKRAMLISPSRNSKAMFEACCATVISGMCLAAVNPQPADYPTRSTVSAVADAISLLYADYLATLDGAYISNADTVNSYVASVQTQLAIQRTVTDTLANLSQLAFSAKQERKVVLEKASNLILLTHKYMGLDADDANIEQFRTINRIGNKELFKIKKGRQITYYV